MTNDGINIPAALSLDKFKTQAHRAARPCQPTAAVIAAQAEGTTKTKYIKI